MVVSSIFFYFGKTRDIILNHLTAITKLLSTFGNKYLFKDYIVYSFVHIKSPILICASLSDVFNYCIKFIVLFHKR
jgi:hypothetical protein